MPHIIKNSITYAAGGSAADIDARIDAKIEEALYKYALHLFSVGDVYLTYSPTENPMIKFGGEWELASKGRVLLGVDPLDISFNTSGLQGGSFKAKLISSNIPTHQHNIPILRGTATQGNTAATGGNHTHTLVHTHNLNNHTHTINHTHPLNNHTHTMGHNHTSYNRLNWTTGTGNFLALTGTSIGNAWFTNNTGAGIDIVQGTITSGASPSTTGGSNASTANASTTVSGASNVASGSASNSISSGSGAHTHNVEIPASTTNIAGEANPTEFNIIPQFETLFVWKRVA